MIGCVIDGVDSGGWIVCGIDWTGCMLVCDADGADDTDAGCGKLGVYS